MHDVGLLDTFWGEAMRTSVYLINRTPTNSQPIQDENEDKVIEIITPAAQQAKLEITTLTGYSKFISPYPLVCKRFSGKFHHVIYTKTKQNFSNKNYYTV